jgi:predicted nucleotidyltransferase
MELSKVRTVAEAMNQEGVEYVIFGGVAVNLHGLARMTEDIDFFVRPDPENVSRIKRALRRVWNDPNIDEIQDDDMVGEYPSVKYCPPDEEFTIDFVSRLGETFAFDDLESQWVDIQGIQVPVATPATLVRMKRDTVRGKDRNDAAALRRKFRLDE